MKTLLLSVGSLLVFFLLLEGASSIYERWYPDPAQSVDDLAVAQSPGAGRIPAEYEEKEPNEIRIFFYGGSAAEGAFVGPAGFAAQTRYFLERAQTDRKVTVTNYSQGGAPSVLVLQKLAQSIRHRPDAVVVMSGNNEFLRDMSDGELALAFGIQNRLGRFALVRAIRRLIARPYLERRRRLVAEDNRRWDDRNSVKFANKIEAYRQNIDTIVQLARSARIPVILCTLPANLLEWPPAGSRWLSGSGPPGASERPIHAYRDQIAAKSPDDALAWFAQELQVNPDPILYFLRGGLRVRLGQFREAREDLLRAKDLDLVPWRALSEFNEFIREKAASPGVYVADFDQLFEAHASHGLVGSDLVSDNCHPTAKGHFWMTREIIEQLTRAGVIEGGALLQEDPDLTAYLKSVGFDVPYSQLRRLKGAGRYAMKSPFFNYEAARALLEAATRIDPRDWEAWVNLASISFMEARIETGKQELRNALAAKPESVDLRALRRQTAPLLEASLKRVNLETDELDLGAARK